MMQDKLEVLETHLAHVDRTLQELSDVVNKQQAQINQLTRLVELMVNREEQEVDVTSERPPPHW